MAASGSGGQYKFWTFCRFRKQVNHQRRLEESSVKFFHCQNQALCLIFSSICLWTAKYENSFRCFQRSSLTFTLCSKLCLIDLWLPFSLFKESIALSHVHPSLQTLKLPSSPCFSNDRGTARASVFPSTFIWIPFIRGRCLSNHTSTCQVLAILHPSPIIKTPLPSGLLGIRFQNPIPRVCFQRT